ncbi:hypothetical protein G9A89_005116 [Geosiphon pyriformis]|nr:hypothetical protein G9A89_005116 [Geosiphon pyriformis]
MADNTIQQPPLIYTPPNSSKIYNSSRISSSGFVELEETQKQQTEYKPSQPMVVYFSKFDKQNTQRSSGKWKYGLFDCFVLPLLSFKTFLCPCITYGKTMENLKSNPQSGVINCCQYTVLSIYGSSCCFSALGRGEIRSQQDIKGTMCKDVAIHCFFGCCALIQEYREVHHE